MTLRRNIAHPNRFHDQTGLSLVELLVIIAVIGFFSAMTIPTIKNIITESLDATAKRNAQNIAMVASVAEVMGTDALAGITSLEEAVDLITSGTDSRFSSAKFTSGELTVDEKQAAIRFLRLDQGVIIFSADPTGVGSSETTGNAATPPITAPVAGF